MYGEVVVRHVWRCCEDREPTEPQKVIKERQRCPYRYPQWRVNSVSHSWLVERGGALWVRVRLNRHARKSDS
jgi:hypothetical protein